MESGPKQRLHQLSGHLIVPNDGPGSSEGIPKICQVAPDSTGKRVEGKVIIITGANSPLGIGRATAHQFAHNGAQAIYICDLRDDYLATHQRELESLYPDTDVHCRQYDVADEAAVRETVDEALEKYGRLDIMFANAGVVGSNRTLPEIEVDEFMKTMRTNVLSVFLATKYAAKAMLKTSKLKPTPSGSIIATASVAGVRSNAGASSSHLIPKLPKLPDHPLLYIPPSKLITTLLPHKADYSASKAAVISLMQTSCYQLGGTNIRCNAICPGLIETGMTAPMYEAARARGSERKVGQLNPLRRGAVADEVARVALFLGSDEASYVNGQAWNVCGGLSAGHPVVPGKLG